MTLIHFIFEIFKIYFLGAMYTTLIYFAIRWIFDKNSAFYQFFSNVNKTMLWFTTWAIICLILFVYMFSYYGNHGLGDSSRIPIANHNVLYQIDLSSYIEDKRGNTYNIDNFVVTDDFVYGTLDELPEEGKTAYFVFDLKLSRIENFENETAFNAYLISKGLNKNVKYQDFSYYYDQYWSGWRFFLLP